MRFQMTTKWKSWLIGLAALGLSGCGGSGGSTDVIGFFSTGQVKAQSGSSTVGFYAASRFAEQVSLDPTQRWSRRFGKRAMRSGLTINLSCLSRKLMPRLF